MSARKPDALKDTECRLRALIRETASLREDLRREQKRKESAVARVKEQERIAAETDRRFHEVKYCNKYASFFLTLPFHRYFQMLEHIILVFTWRFEFEFAILAESYIQVRTIVS